MIQKFIDLALAPENIARTMNLFAVLLAIVVGAVFALISYGTGSGLEKAALAGCTIAALCAPLFMWVRHFVTKREQHFD